MNSKNSKTSDHHRILLNLSKKKLKEVIKILLYQVLTYTAHGKL